MEFRQRYFVSRPGLSFVEVLMVIGVIAILASVSIGGFVASRQRAAVTNQASVAETFIREAKSRAMTARDGQSWGVICDGGSLRTVSFSGNFVTSLRTDDNRLPFASNVTCQTGTEVGFTKLTGQPQADVNFTLFARGTAFKRISIVAPGVITVSTI